MLIPAKLAKIIVLENKAYHTIVIAEQDGPRHFPIEIGLFEAIALLRKVEDKSSHLRPLTHDLLSNSITALGGRVRQVHIIALRKGTFYANLIVETDDGEIAVDARPSDALVLAAAEKCELLVDDSVFEQTTRTP